MSMASFVRPVLAMLAALLRGRSAASDPGADPYFPVFHVRPPENWINDPNGPFRDPRTGLIHLWMQYNPGSANWGNMSWYHVVSWDGVTWEHVGVTEALRFNPSKYPYADAGFYSGSVTLVNGSHPVIAYTCAGTKAQLQCLAWPKNTSDPMLVEWQEDPDNPVIASVPPGGLSITIFRDPTTALWDERRQLYLMHIATSLKGAGSEAGGAPVAAVVGYSADSSFRRWSFDSILLQENYVPRGMFECPDFFDLQPTEADDIMSPAGIWVLKLSMMVVTLDFYWLGLFDWESREFVRMGSAVPLDYGNYYASKSFFDPVMNRRIIFGWVREYGLSNGKWAGLQALPRVMEYDSQYRTLRVYPLPSLDGLRQETLYHSAVPQVLSATSPLNLVKPGGSQQQEIIATITFPQDLFDIEPEAFLGLRIREVSATQYASVGLTSNPLGGQILNTTDIPGIDYMNFPMSPHAPDAANAQNCSDFCLKDLRCVAWTYVLPGQTRASESGRTADAPSCALKTFATAAQRKTSVCCVSGFVKSPLLILDTSSSGTQGATFTTGGRARVMPDPEVAGRARVSLHVFNDGSVTESFKDQGLERLTARLYIPERDSAGVSVVAKGTEQATLETAEVYALGTIWDKQSSQRYPYFL